MTMMKKLFSRLTKSLSLIIFKISIVNHFFDFSVAIQFTIEFDDHTSEIVHIIIDLIDSKSSFVLVFGLESVQRKIRPGGLEKQSKRHEEQLIELRTNREYQQNAKFDRKFSKYTLYSDLVCVS